ncbi:hypothetical protein V6N12_013006 [Hibiscus sabdariffa]|uniref:Uncharacterized protein n=1 Tax=Hibiscus sabdariffa TaxID=183260 RepID=A0ABR2EGH3_9ROSI
MVFIPRHGSKCSVEEGSQVAKDCCQIEKNKLRTSSPATDFDKEGASTETTEGVYCQALNEKGVGPPARGVC